MKLVISNTGYPFQFAVSRNSVYSFDVEIPVEISDADYTSICEKIGRNCLKEVVQPQETVPATQAQELSQDAQVGDSVANQE